MVHAYLVRRRRRSTAATCPATSHSRARYLYSGQIVGLGNTKAPRCQRRRGDRRRVSTCCGVYDTRRVDETLRADPTVRHTTREHSCASMGTRRRGPTAPSWSVEIACRAAHIARSAMWAGHRQSTSHKSTKHVLIHAFMVRRKDGNTKKVRSLSPSAIWPLTPLQAAIVPRFHSATPSTCSPA